MSDNASPAGNALPAVGEVAPEVLAARPQEDLIRQIQLIRRIKQIRKERQVCPHP